MHYIIVPKKALTGLVSCSISLSFSSQTLMMELNWQPNLLAAPVVSWVRKHYAEPVTSAAGFVNVGTPTGRKPEVRDSNVYKNPNKLAWADLVWYTIGKKHWSFLRTHNEANVTILLRTYYKMHLSSALFLFKSNRLLSKFTSNMDSFNIGTCFPSEKCAKQRTK